MPSTAIRKVYGIRVERCPGSLTILAYADKACAYGVGDVEVFIFLGWMVSFVDVGIYFLVVYICIKKLKCQFFNQKNVLSLTVAVYPIVRTY